MAAVMKQRRKQDRTRQLPESIINNAPKLLCLAVGEASAQGDVIIVRIASLPASAKPSQSWNAEFGGYQLAPGNTPGSRHILKRGQVFDADPAEVQALIHAANKCEVGLQYLGLVFVSPTDPTDSDLWHPEHGPQGFDSAEPRPAGSPGIVCAVVGQRNQNAERREQRVQD